MAEFVRRELPFGRFGRADEVGDVVAFLRLGPGELGERGRLTVDGCQSWSN